MRIIAGEKRGTKLFAPEDSLIRPTSDRVKESLFGIIQFDINGADFLDICSGTGNLGLEAVSRGARQAVFIDNDEKSIELLKKNIDKLKFNNKCEVIKNDALVALKKLSLENRQFDYILFDPPYGDLDLYKAVIEYVLQKGLLKDDGTMMVEHDEKLVLPTSISDSLYDKRKYGSTYISFIGRQKK